MADHKGSHPQSSENTKHTSPPTSWKWKRIVGVGYGGPKLRDGQQKLST